MIDELLVPEREHLADGDAFVVGKTLRDDIAPPLLQVRDRPVRAGEAEPVKKKTERRPRHPLPEPQGAEQHGEKQD